MSMAYYIASSKELPLGEFQSNKVKISGSNNKDIKAIKIISGQLSKDYTPVDKIIDISDLKIGEDGIKVYETYVDAAGIYIKNIELQDEKMKKQFKNKYIYEVSPNWGKFLISEGLKNQFPDVFAINKKCINDLFEYIRQNISNNDEIEMYTCWIGQESDQNFHTVIDLKDFILGDNFKFEENQYILIRN